jgi:hypothetical protein
MALFLPGLSICDFTARSVDVNALGRGTSLWVSLTLYIGIGVPLALRQSQTLINFAACRAFNALRAVEEWQSNSSAIVSLVTFLPFSTSRMISFISGVGLLIGQLFCVIPLLPVDAAQTAAIAAADFVEC